MTYPAKKPQPSTIPFNLKSKIENLQSNYSFRELAQLSDLNSTPDPAARSSFVNLLFSLRGDCFITFLQSQIKNLQSDSSFRVHSQLSDLN